ncbi:MAG TPA: type II toxin-antitoxin system HicB family antitoxin [Ktedonobacterales bacterium]|jgi:predicted RNase H-like HicB family nuclease
MNYSMLIQWSDEDQVYVVTLPEWEASGHACRTHGASYVEAAARGEEMLRFVLDAARQDGDRIPAPNTLSDQPSVTAGAPAV